VNRLFGGMRRWISGNMKPVATIQRAELVDNKRGLPVTIHTDVLATPVLPMDSQTRDRMLLQSTYEMFYTYTLETDVKRGDGWTQEGIAYKVERVEVWGEQANPAFVMVGVSKVTSG
jgi:hypothetical protein